MEFLGIAAAKEEEGQNYARPSILRAFRLFLNKVKNISTQRVTFYEMFYEKSDVPREVLAKTPLLLDPTNPWNNYMDRFNKDAQDFFSKCAQVTLTSLEKVETQCRLNHEYPAFAELFLTQPPMKDLKAGGVRPTYWFVENPESSTKTQPNLIIRNKALKEKGLFDAIPKAMSAFVYSANLQAERGGSTTNIQDLIRKSIGDSMQGASDYWGPPRPSASSWLRSEVPGSGSGWGTPGPSYPAAASSSASDYDVTLEVPVVSGKSTIKIHSNWSDV